MFKPFAQTVILITLITLVGACGPAATSIPPTATAVPVPTMQPTTAPPTVGQEPVDEIIMRYILPAVR
jgi:hypothetical protein